MFNHSSQLKDQLKKALSKKGEDYQARTRHLDDNTQPIYTNRLILEDSPYLLQHAHNPVDWYPWGKEAFEQAKQHNKPVFLSIGYSTCHWCHVMEEESFDNEDVAKVMNELFICIKVDRELNPDVDTYYMTAVMMMQGQGGWPMSSFLTPDRKPFFGATYFRPGQFLTLMHRVDELWQQQYQDLIEQADHYSQQISNAMAARTSLNEIGINVVELTAQTLMNHYDPQHAGFGGVPKFPNEPYLYFLFDYVIFKQDEEILSRLTKTLDILLCGGIYDQFGGGFHRYATDANWLIPHFEKMLYNQANLAFIYTQAWQITHNPEYKRISTEILGYVLREMTNAEGAFYSATDADSEGEEGKYFVWDSEEIKSILGNDAGLLIDLYQFSDAGNFEGYTIPNLDKPLNYYAKKNGHDYDELLIRLDKIKETLLAERIKRIPPLLDDKVITAWNGMMIKAFSFASLIFNESSYIVAAERAAHYVLKTNKTNNNQLSRTSLNGNATTPALQEDYAYLAEALLLLYDATQNNFWLKHARELTNYMLKNFWDKETGGFFMSAQTGNDLLPSAPKETQDNATSSGNSVALNLVSRLWRRTGDTNYQHYGQQLVQAFSDDISQRPYSSAYMIKGLLELLAGEQQSYCWAGNGKVFLNAHAMEQDEHYLLSIDINISEGNYLNLQEDSELPVLLETERGWHVEDIEYPDTVEKQVQYQTETKKVYEGNITINAKLRAIDTNKLNICKLKLTLQACDTTHCLAYEKHIITVFLDH